MTDLDALFHRKVEPVRRMVVHVKEPHDVFIGRPSCWGNPYPGAMFGRTVAIAKFTRWLTHQPEMMARVRAELPGKVLGCFCRPKKPCHGDVLAELANPPEDRGDVDFFRVDGGVLCPRCRQPYADHRDYLGMLDWQDNAFLRVLCDGRLVKL